MRAYLEITTVCNRRCPFCAGTARKEVFLSPERFRERLKKVLPYADTIFLHLMGEPLLHPQFGSIAEICNTLDAKVCLVTNGTLLEGKEALLLENPAFRQINFSLHALDEKSPRDREKLERILSFARSAQVKRPELYINLRLWNMNGPRGEQSAERNAFLLSRIGESFPLPCSGLPAFSPGRKSLRLAGRIYLNRDSVFQWPEREKETSSVKGFCHGMRDQFGVLADGRIVPCCLDTEGRLALGNLDETEDAATILFSPEAEEIRRGFEKGIAVKEFCKKCSFRTRFRK